MPHLHDGTACEPRRCSESQKIGHVTFFWNGNRGGPFNKDLEKHKEVGISCLASRQLVSML